MYTTYQQRALTKLAIFVKEKKKKKEKRTFLEIYM